MKKPAWTSNKRNARIFMLAAFAAPFATVQAARVFMASGPSAAPGATITSALPTPGGPSDFGPPIIPSKPTAGQQKALDWLTAQRLHAPVTPSHDVDLSPMDRAEAKAPTPPPPKPVDPLPPVAPQAPVADALKSLKLTAVMGVETQAGGAIAVIGGKLRRAGDEVAPGWRIDSINARDWVVRLTHTSGETAALTGIRPSQTRD